MGRNQMLEKVIQVSKELCTGCGSCIEACSAGAIHLVDHQAEIDETLCIACEACVEACQNGAIIAITAPFYNAPITVQPVTDSGLELKQPPTMLPGTAVPVRGLKPLAGAALSFLGSEVAPRLVDVLIKSIEDRLMHLTTTTISPSISSSRDYSIQNRGQRKKIRHRGGRIGNRKYNGRR
jgi:NAD-dependent dihydropyrimidine dehydrogenase PreA subunit